MSLDSYYALLVGKTVLVVDDEPDSLEIAETLLTDLGVKVLVANNGRQALILLEDEHPDYIISDLSMPVMSGWDLIAALKQDRRLMDIPVFALTAHVMPGDRSKAIAAGFHNYLTKPLNPDTFVNDLLSLIQQLHT
ncbi:MAG: response regulator [Anaerolineae bacterium]|nr:response regulator [Anaerolineae bacterium]MDW8170852.1 response regulator [Anaerolineae bacterium]